MWSMSFAIIRLPTAVAAILQTECKSRIIFRQTMETFHTAEVLLPVADAVQQALL